MSHPRAKRLVISESASSTRDPADQDVSHIDIAYNGQTIHKALKLVDPLTVAEETQCRWYVQRYASQEPFEGVKAVTAAGLIDGYGAKLLDQLGLNYVLNCGKEDALEEQVILEVEISESGQYTEPDRNGIHRLHWELLEAPSLWQNCFREIVVRRRVQGVPEKKRSVRSVGLNFQGDGHYSFNVLLVLARDTEVNGTSYQDVDPSVTSNVFFAIQRVLRQRDLNYSLNLEVVRPGTFAAFRKHLQKSTEKKGTGHFHLVHFDLHGKIANQIQEDGKKYVRIAMSPDYDTIVDVLSNRIPTACLRFVSSRSLTGLELVPAGEVARLLQSHSIESAVLKACDSARSDKDVNANLAKVFANHGVSNILAMSHKFLSSAAAPFFASFYWNFFLRRLNFSFAASKARGVLMKNPQRQARLGMKLDVKDWFISIVYIAGQEMQIDGPIASVAMYKYELGDTLDSKWAHTDEGVIGRDYDVLRLERMLADSDVVFLQGSPGVGKSAMMRHAIESWRKTNAYDSAVFVDLLRDPITFADVEEQIVNQTSNISEASCQNADRASSGNAVVQRMRQGSNIVVLDGLDYIYAKVFSEGFELIQAAVTDLLRQIRQPFSDNETARPPKVVLVGILDKGWWVEHFGFLNGDHFPLAGLDLPAALQLSRNILQKEGIATDYANQKELDSLANIVNILQRIPLALELVLPQAVKHLSLKEFYDRLHFGEISVPIHAPRKPPNIADIKLMLHFQTIFDRFQEYRDMLCCLADFWHEGPVQLDKYFKRLRDLAGIHWEDRFDKMVLYLGDCGGWKFEEGAPSMLSWIHPLLTLSLRQMRRDHKFQGPPFWHRGIIRAVQFMNSEAPPQQFGSTSSIRIGIAQAYVHEVAIRDKTRTLTSALLGFDGPRMGQEMRVSMYNMLNCYHICCLPESPIEIRSWPKELLISYLGPSQLIMSLTEQELLAKYVEDALEIYLRECRGFEVPPGDRGLALNLSIHLTTFAASGGWLDRGRIRQMLTMSSAIVEASELRYGRFQGSDIPFKGMVFRFLAVEALIDGDGNAADEAWEKTKATDIESFGPESVTSPTALPDLSDTHGLLGGSWSSTAQASSSNDHAAILNTLNLDPLSDNRHNVLASWAQVRHSAWPWLRERILATKDASLIDSFYLPQINRSFQGVSDSQDKAGIEGMGHWKRYFPPCNDVAAQLKRVQDSKWQIEELESAKDKGDWKSTAQGHMELWQQAAKAQDLDRALHHLTELITTLKESGPPGLPLHQMEAQKKIIEMTIRLKAAFEQDPTMDVDDSDCLELVEAMKQAGMHDIDETLRALGASGEHVRDFLRAAERSERLDSMIQEYVERMRLRDRSGE